MKKILLLTVFLFVSFLSFGQCPNTFIELTSQSDIDNFAVNYPGCTEIINGFEVRGQDITNLNGLIQLESSTISSFITIVDTGISNFSGLENLHSIGRKIEVFENPDLINFNGLEQLQSIQSDLFVAGNASLTSFEGLSSLISVGGKLHIDSNPLLEDFNGMSNLSSLGVESGNPVGNRGLDLDGNNALSNFTGLENLTEINGSVIIKNNSNLQNFIGLENVTEVASAFIVQNNDAILNLQGFNSLVTTGFALHIDYNDQLLNLVGLEALQKFDGSLSLTNNDNLNSIDALSNAVDTSVGSYIVVENNPNLPYCAIEVVCGNINDPTLFVLIEDNAVGCNSISEVKADCILSVSNNELTVEIALYPNPVSEKLQIRVTEGTVFEKATVHSILGEELFFTSEETVDFSQFTVGIYFVKVTTNRGSVTKKVVKE